jgi:hypothetical protein
MEIESSNKKRQTMTASRQDYARSWPNGTKLIPIKPDYYRVFIDTINEFAEGITVDTMQAAYKAAYKLLLDQGEYIYPVIIWRIMEHEPLFNNVFGHQKIYEHTIVATDLVYFPHFTKSPLSSYHPNNGWLPNLRTTWNDRNEE